MLKINLSNKYHLYPKVDIKKHTIDVDISVLKYMPFNQSYLDYIEIFQNFNFQENNKMSIYASDIGATEAFLYIRERDSLYYEDDVYNQNIKNWNNVSKITKPDILILKDNEDIFDHKHLIYSFTNIDKNKVQEIANAHQECYLFNPSVSNNHYIIGLNYTKNIKPGVENGLSLYFNLFYTLDKTFDIYKWAQQYDLLIQDKIYNDDYLYSKQRMLKMSFTHHSEEGNTSDMSKLHFLKRKLNRLNRCIDTKDYKT